MGPHRRGGAPRREGELAGTGRGDAGRIGGGFNMMIQDQRGRGALELAVQHLMQAAAQSPDLAGLFSLFNTRTPRVYAGIDRVQSEILGVPASRAFERSEEHTSELQSLMRITYAVFCLKKKKQIRLIST